MYETHCHTPLCKHATGDPEEYADAALQAGLKGVIVTCHNPMPDGYGSQVRMRIDQFDTYLEMVDRARKACAGRIDVRLGLECDFFPGYEDWLEGQAEAAEYDYLLGSVHPQQDEFYDRYWTGDAIDFQRCYFELLADTAEFGLFDCISHPDLIKNQTADQWQPSQVMADICRTLDRIAACGIAMELNTSGLNKIVPEMNPFPAMLTEMQARGIPVVVGADAHKPERVGENFEDALQLLDQCGYTHVSYFLDRQRHDISLASARESLRRVRV